MLLALIYSLLYFIFVFLLGAGSVVALIFYLGNLRENLERRSRDEKLAAIRSASADASGQQRLPPLPDTKSGWIVIKSEKEHPKGTPLPKPYFVLLKANMLLVYQNEKDETPLLVACLDGCTVTTVKKRKGKPRWHKSTTLQLQHPVRSIFFEKQTCFLFFAIGKDLEAWFLALWRATQVAQLKKDAKGMDMQRREHEFFYVLSNLYKSPGYPIDPVTTCWFNALAGRVFWNVHDQPYFIDLLSRKMREKIAKIQKPPFVNDIQLKDLVFGPSLPQFTNIQLVFLSEDGSLALDCDVKYQGGFKVVIEIVIKIPATSMTVSVVITATLQSLSGRARIAVNPVPSETLWIAFHSEPECKLHIDTNIANSYTLLNIPSVTNIVVEKLKTEVMKVMLLPQMDDYELPHRQDCPHLTDDDLFPPPHIDIPVPPVPTQVPPAVPVEIPPQTITGGSSQPIRIQKSTSSTIPATASSMASSPSQISALGVSPPREIALPATPKR